MTGLLQDGVQPRMIESAGLENVRRLSNRPCQFFPNPAVWYVISQKCIFHHHHQSELNRKSLNADVGITFNQLSTSKNAELKIMLHVRRTVASIQANKLVQRPLIQVKLCGIAPETYKSYTAHSFTITITVTPSRSTKLQRKLIINTNDLSAAIHFQTLSCLFCGIHY